MKTSVLNILAGLTGSVYVMAPVAVTTAVVDYSQAVMAAAALPMLGMMLRGEHGEVVRSNMLRLLNKEGK